MEENEIIIPIARDLRNDRCDGLRSLLMPRQEETNATTYLKARDLVIDTAELNSADSANQGPSIQMMLHDWHSLEDR